MEAFNDDSIMTKIKKYTMYGVKKAVKIGVVTLLQRTIEVVSN